MIYLRFAGAAPSWLSRRPSTVDRQWMSGNERRPLGKQPEDPFGNLLRLAKSSDRLTGDHFRLRQAAGIQRPLDHRSAYYTRAYAVDPNVFLCVFERGRPCESDHTVLGGDIGRGTAEAQQAGNRGGVNDRTATLLEHLWNLIFHTQPYGFQIDRNDAIEIFLGALDCVAELALDARIVESAIQPPIVLDRLADNHFDLRGERHIGCDTTRLAACLLDHLDRAFRTFGHVIHDHHFRPFLCEPERGGAANARSTAGY